MGLARARVAPRRRAAGRLPTPAPSSEIPASYATARDAGAKDQVCPPGRFGRNGRAKEEDPPIGQAGQPREGLIDTVTIPTSIPQNTALLVIDFQRAIDHPSWGTRNNPEAEENVRQLLAFWRRTSRPIVHVRHVSRFPESTYRDGQPGVEFKETALPLPGEPVITKQTGNAFVATPLESLLRDNGIRDVVIAGVITNNSVESTARMAGDLGFRTIVVSDGTFTFGRKDFSGRSRTAEEVHAMSLANLDGEYASILTTGEVLKSAGG